MAFRPEMLWSVVRITSGGDLRGTGFIVSVASDAIPGRRWRYVITADHVIRYQAPLELEVPDAFTGALHPPFDFSKAWRKPFDGIDLALAPLPDRPGQPFLDVNLEAEALDGSVINHGVPIFYIGIFEDAKTTMVRSGTVGALSVPIQKTNPPYSYDAHLVDCRSYEGFSGSPCFVMFDYPLVEMPAVVPVPARALDDKGPVETAHVAALVGLFTAHYDDENDPAISKYGIGVMLPMLKIWEALMTDDAKAERREWDEQEMSSRRERQREPTDAGRHPAPGNEFDRFEDLTRHLVSTPKPRPEDG
jgi:hypothetical protein